MTGDESADTSHNVVIIVVGIDVDSLPTKPCDLQIFLRRLSLFRHEFHS